MKKNKTVRTLGDLTPIKRESTPRGMGHRNVWFQPDFDGSIIPMNPNPFQRLPNGKIIARRRKGSQWLMANNH